jgi:hypothetical protein
MSSPRNISCACPGRDRGRHDFICESVLRDAFGEVGNAPQDVLDLLTAKGRLTTGGVVKGEIVSSRNSRWVSERHVLCSLPIRRDALAMSDCCRASAVGAVYDERTKAYLYRCQSHLEIVTNFGGSDGLTQILGPVFAELPEPPDSWG